MYIYCNNNPIKYIDPNGESASSSTNYDYTDYKIKIFASATSSVTVRETNVNSGKSATLSSGTSFKILGGYGSKVLYRVYG